MRRPALAPADTGPVGVESVQPRYGRFVDFPDARVTAPAGGWTVGAAIVAATAYADEHALGEADSKDYRRHLGALYFTLADRMSHDERRREVRFRMQRSAVVEPIYPTASTVSPAPSDDDDETIPF